MATVHMIHGFVCVGKSTFAAELAAKVKGICISPDEWVVSVFGSNTPEEGWSRELFDERYWRIRDRRLPAAVDRRSRRRCCAGLRLLDA